MSPNNDTAAGSGSEHRRHIRRWAVIVPVFVLLVCAEVLIGWQINNRYMKSIVPGLITMNPTTCVCLAMLAIASLGRAFGNKRVVYIFATAAALVGSVKLYSLLSGVHIPIDEWVFHGRLNNTFEGKPSRIALNTALNLALTGLSLILAQSRRHWLRKVHVVLSSASIVLAMLALNGYLYGIRSLYGLGSFLPMALHVAVCFLVLNTVLLLPATTTPEWSKKGYMRRGVVAGFGAMLVIFVGVNTLVVQNVRGLIASRTEVDGNYNTILTLQRTLSTLQDAETGQRGYILTRQQSYLEPYQQAQRQLPALQAELEQLMPNDRRLQQLEELETAKMSELDQTVSLEKQGRHAQALKVIDTNVGKHTMDQIRRQFATIIDAQNVALAAGKQSENSSNYTTSLLATVGTVSTVLLLGAVYYLLLRQIKRQLQEQGRVEKLVAERTSSLEGERARLNAAIESLGYGFMIVDVDKQVVNANTAVKAWVKDAGQVSVKMLDDFLGGAVHLSELIDTSIAAKRRSDSIKVQVDTVALNIAVYPIIQKQQVIGAVVTFEDISEREALDRSRDEFFSIASHELRTPLTAIRGNAQMLLDYYPEVNKDTEVHQMLDDMRSASKRLTDVVNSFLDVSRMEQGKLLYERQAFDVRPLVAEVLHEAASSQAKHVKLINKLSDAELPELYADVQRTRQILTNLVGNALKYTDKGSVTVAAELAGDKLRISVADTGMGIAPESQHLLFRKFQQASNNILTRDNTRSTGLGLYTSEFMARDMGGKLYLESTAVGKGSTFVLELPLHKAS